MERAFLGWKDAPLERAADWLVERFGADMADVLVALPGARSGRILSELLARRSGGALKPPRVVTAGLASDALLEVEGAPAGRLVRTLAWKEALAGLDAATLSRIVARPPEVDDLAGWLRLAEEVRGLFGEVAAEGMEFGHVAANEVLAPLEGEQRRWAALAQAQERMVALLDGAGFVDPHVGRLAAIRAERVRDVGAVVLVGVSEMNELLRRALALCDDRVTSLVFAPDELADSFDAWGGLLPEAWSRWHTSLDAESQWFVVDGPADQADRVARVIAGFGGRYAAEDITLGVADREVAPYLQGTLGALGVTARDAAGTPMGRTRPARLLEAVAHFAEGRRFADLAALVRHPDFEAALRTMDEGLEAVDWVDAYHNTHLPSRVDGVWLADPDERGDPRLAAEMGRLWGAVRDLLGALLDGGDLPAAAVTPAVRALLQRIHGGRELDPAEESDRILIASLARFGEALGELEALPAAFAPSGSVAATLSLLCRMVANDEVAPAAARANEPTIEMLGWLELALDDAAALVVTGFEDGRVPESVRGDSYLPNRLRQSLGIVDNEKRLARDLYATELLLQSREQVAFVTGRRNVAGDPQRPSRIIFHCDEAEVVPRVKRFVDAARQPVPRLPAGAGIAAERPLPRLDDEPQIEAISVTAFSRFLASPYQFYLERIAGLETLDDRARELDGSAFGSLAHRVLADFGEDAQARDEVDEDRIRQFLLDRLHAIAGLRFGDRPLPAVRLQLQQLERRLTVFAGVQAARRTTGWEIRESEWAPEPGHVDFQVDDVPIRLRGRIDRIDHHPERNEWAIWDYKTGENVGDPRAAHRSAAGEWRDLQLPLYCVLAEGLLGEAEPTELGYITLPRDIEKLGFKSPDRWGGTQKDPEPFGDALGSALETARDVVRRIRAGEFFDAESFAPRDPIFQAIAGLGVMASEAEVEE
ncbi:MAG: PD-(D/E)XK nuclease family protein [Deltaproteobacteria bacterium]|nr:PD-(D/E)XK nuclease family protein [Deltaproteobacteria bacterium]